jgi:hypothetical protein
VGEFYGHFDLDRTPYSDRMFETMGRLATVLLVLTAIANV